MNDQAVMTCAECRQRLPAYQDDGLMKTESMRVFLHLRRCEECTHELDRLKRLVTRLECLPRREPPADFDARILASVPYEAYRAMADLRKPRVPLFLSEDALPQWFRSRTLRWTGAALAAAALAGHAAGLLPGGVIAAAAAGLLPEVVLRLQGFGRRLVLAAGQSRRGG